MATKQLKGLQIGDNIYTQIDDDDVNEELTWSSQKIFNDAYEIEPGQGVGGTITSYDLEEQKSLHFKTSADDAAVYKVTIPNESNFLTWKNGYLREKDGSITQESSTTWRILTKNIIVPQCGSKKSNRLFFSKRPFHTASSIKPNIVFYAENEEVVSFAEVPRDQAFGANESWQIDIPENTYSINISVYSGWASDTTVDFEFQWTNLNKETTYQITNPYKGIIKFFSESEFSILTDTIKTPKQIYTDLREHIAALVIDLESTNNITESDYNAETAWSSKTVYTLFLQLQTAINTLAGRIDDLTSDTEPDDQQEPVS